MLLTTLQPPITAYQERVPLQLLDFAYRYTSSVLQDAVHLSAEGYTGIAPDGSIVPVAGSARDTGTGRGRGAGAAATTDKVEGDFSTVNISSLRLAIGSRLQYQFQQGLGKEYLIAMATERNGVRLPGIAQGVGRGVGPEVGGVKLPGERFVLTGRGWGLRDGWESEGDEEEEEVTGAEGMEGITGEIEAGDEEEEDADEGMEDIFGDSGAVDGDAADDGDMGMMEE